MILFVLTLTVRDTAWSKSLKDGGGWEAGVKDGKGEGGVERGGGGIQCEYFHILLELRHISIKINVSYCHFFTHLF